MMFREKHFTDYARRVAEADAGKDIGSSEAPALPEAPDLDALRAGVAPPPRAPAQRGWIGKERSLLEPEPRNRDYGGYRPAVGKYADPAEHGAEWQGKTLPPGEAPKP